MSEQILEIANYPNSQLEDLANIFNVKRVRYYYSPVDHSIYLLFNPAYALRCNRIEDLLKTKEVLQKEKEIYESDYRKFMESR